MVRWASFFSRSASFAVVGPASLRRVNWIWSVPVGDVGEAVSSDRPYRPGLGVDAALEEIERGSGSVYDSAVVDACVRLFRERGFAFES